MESGTNEIELLTNYLERLQNFGVTNIEINGETSNITAIIEALQTLDLTTEAGKQKF